ncbi:MAG: hypothetical protein PHC85_01870 [Candidatus Pacebacteria bacterium]|nr:hypothetical protein [Candidatus Paceibacterota bacterium]
MPLKCSFCNNDLDLSRPEALGISAFPSSNAFPCKACGLFHFIREDTGEALVAEIIVKEAFFLKNGEVIQVQHGPPVFA